MAGANFPIGSVSGTSLNLAPWLESMQTELQRQLQNRSQDMQGQQFDRSMDMREADQAFGQKMNLDEMALKTREFENQKAMGIESVMQREADRKAQKEALDSELQFKQQQDEADQARKIELENMRANADHERDKFRLDSEMKLRADEDMRKQQAEQKKAQQAEADAAMAENRQMEFDRTRDEAGSMITQKVQWADDGSLSLYIPQETSPEMAAKGISQPPIERKFQTVADAAETMRQSFTKGLEGDQRLAVESAVDKWEQSALKRQADERARAKFELDQQAKQAEIALKEAQREKMLRETDSPKGLTFPQRQAVLKAKTTFDPKTQSFGDPTLNSLLATGKSIKEQLDNPAIADAAKIGLRDTLQKILDKRNERIAELKRKWAPEAEEDASEA